MNILKIADGVTGLFPKKIMVTVVDEVSGVVIGSFKAGKESLPEQFDRPMAIELNGVVWRVVNAEWLSGKRLSLAVQEEEYFRSHNKRWMVPTVAPRPKLGDVRMANDFVMEIGLEEWRQVEFLPAGMQEVVEEEMKLVEVVSRDGGLLGYETVHQRVNTDELILKIPSYEFYQLVEGNEKGNIELEEDGIVQDGFFIRSEAYVYYGVVKDGWIRWLGVTPFKALDDQVMKVIEGWDLLLVDWLNGRTI